MRLCYSIYLLRTQQTNFIGRHELRTKWDVRIGNILFIVTTWTLPMFIARYTNRYLLLMQFLRSKHVGHDLMTSITY
jgi:hypothetical protein